MVRFNKVVGFIEANHRNSSRYRIEEHNMLSWIKQQRKFIKAGTFKSERMKMFEKLKALMEVYRKVNHYMW